MPQIVFHSWSHITKTTIFSACLLPQSVKWLLLWFKYLSLVFKTFYTVGFSGNHLILLIPFADHSSACSYKFSLHSLVLFYVSERSASHIVFPQPPVVFGLATPHGRHGCKPGKTADRKDQHLSASPWSLARAPFYSSVALYLTS